MFVHRTLLTMVCFYNNGAMLEHVIVCVWARMYNGVDTQMGRMAGN